MSKTNVMWLGAGKFGDIKIGNKIVSRTECYKYLGTELDRNLNGKTHLKERTKTVLRMTGLAWKAANKLSLESQVQMCYGFLYPVLTYGCLTSYPIMDKTTQDKWALEVTCLQRCSLNAPSYASDLKVDQIYKIPSLKKLIFQ